MRRLWDRSKFKPNDFLMAVCGHDCESDSKMQYCRVFCYKIDETRCTVVSCNEKLIENIHFPLGKQWFLVQDIENTQDFNVFCKQRWKYLLYRSKPLNIDRNHCTVDMFNKTYWPNNCEAIVSRLWVGCRIELGFWIGSWNKAARCPWESWNDWDAIVRRLWVDCESDVESSYCFELAS